MEQKRPRLAPLPPFKFTVYFCSLRVVFSLSVWLRAWSQGWVAVSGASGCNLDSVITFSVLVMCLEVDKM